MLDKSMNDLVSLYKDILADGDFKMTYQYLVGIIQNIKTEFSKKYKDEFKVGNVLHGYIDFTYFYLQNDFLKNKRLKFAIVLNHQKANFELWLVGQTKDIQRDYWKKLEHEKWVDSERMPEYSISENSLLKNPDYDNENKILEIIQSRFTQVSQEIIDALESSD